MNSFYGRQVNYLSRGKALHVFDAYRIIAVAAGFSAYPISSSYLMQVYPGCFPSCGRPANTSVVFSEVADTFGMGDTHTHLACLE